MERSVRDQYMERSQDEHECYLTKRWKSKGLGQASATVFFFCFEAKCIGTSPSDQIPKTFVELTMGEGTFCPD